MGKKGMPRDLEARLYFRSFAASASWAARSVEATGPVELGLVRSTCNALLHILSHTTTVYLQAALTSEHFVGLSLATD